MNISGIDGISRNGNQIGAGAGEDAKTKSIKDQIARVQKKLQDLAANEDISLEEKMKKRQELQKQLSEKRHRRPSKAGRRATVWAVRLKPAESRKIPRLR